MIRPAKESRSYLPILLLSAAGFTILATELVIVGLLPSMAKDLQASVSQAGLLVTLFAFTAAAAGPYLDGVLGQPGTKTAFRFRHARFGSFSKYLGRQSGNCTWRNSRRPDDRSLWPGKCQRCGGGDRCRGHRSRGIFDGHRVSQRPDLRRMRKRYRINRV